MFTRRFTIRHLSTTKQANHKHTLIGSIFFPRPIEEKVHRVGAKRPERIFRPHLIDRGRLLRPYIGGSPPSISSSALIRVFLRPIRVFQSRKNSTDCRAFLPYWHREDGWRIGGLTRQEDLESHPTYKGQSCAGGTHFWLASTNSIAVWRIDVHYLKCIPPKSRNPTQSCPSASNRCNPSPIGGIPLRSSRR